MKDYLMFSLLGILVLCIAGCGGSNLQTSSTGLVKNKKNGEGAMSSVSSIAIGESSKVAALEIKNREDLRRITVIYFDYDSSIVRSDFKEVLAAHAGYLVEKPSGRVVLEGHTDQRGTREYNLALGERRGQSVWRQLLILGASESQIDIVSFGEERPDMFGQTEQEFSLNRRVEIVY